jgi:uncharacterized protein YdcH (DUF465 family)
MLAVPRGNHCAAIRSRPCAKEPRSFEETVMDWTGDDDEVLAAANEEYRELKRQHQEYQDKLARLAAKRALTDEDKVEEVRIKKEKLFLKDRMAALRREHAASKA